MTKSDWGTKHSCQGCGTKYYDLNRSRAVCPSCGAAFNPEALLRSRRTRPVSIKETEAAKKAVVPTAASTKAAKETAADPVAADPVAAVAGAEDLDGEEDEKLIKDASELSEDGADIADVPTGGDGDIDDT